MVTIDQIKRILTTWRAAVYRRPPWTNLPYGWINSRDGHILHECARLTEGPILEVGSFVGRSTCFIAQGIRKNKYGPIPFCSIDLHASTPEELLTYFAPLGFDKLHAKYQHYMDLGGSFNILQENLDRFGVQDLVDILQGDFLDVVPKKRYSMIFLDVTHNEEEIKRNVPPILTLSRPGTVLICHDINHDGLLEVMRNTLNFTYSIRQGWSFVGILGENG